MKQLLKQISNKKLKAIYKELIHSDKESNDIIDNLYKYIYILGDYDGNFTFDKFKTILLDEIHERNIHIL